MVVVVTGRALLVASAAVLLVAGAVAMAVPGPRSTVDAALWPREVAGRESLEAQRGAAELAVQRGYVAGIGRLAEVRRLTLAIPSGEAAAISERAAADLLRVRREALAAVGASVGLRGAELEAHVAASEQRLGDGLPPEARPALLAPDLYSIVRRADELYAQLIDAAIRELTRAPSPTPSRSP